MTSKEELLAYLDEQSKKLAEMGQKMYYKDICVDDFLEEYYQYKQIEKIIKSHKLLNYVLKNKKCADMYKLNEEEINKLQEWLEK